MTTYLCSFLCLVDRVCLFFSSCFFIVFFFFLMIRRPPRSTLLHDALPISIRAGPQGLPAERRQLPDRWNHGDGVVFARSEEHTSELQSHSDLVCRLLLEKKKKKKKNQLEHTKDVTVQDL